MGIVLGYDPITLREQVDVDAARARLKQLDELQDAKALSEKTSLLRLLGRFDEARDAADRALRIVREAGQPEAVCLARIRRAQVQQFSGELDEARTELNRCIKDAHEHGWSSTEAYALQHRGKVHFDQGQYRLALDDFRAAAGIRSMICAPESQLESSLLAVRVTESRVDQ